MYYFKNFNSLFTDLITNLGLITIKRLQINIIIVMLDFNLHLGSTKALLLLSEIRGFVVKYTIYRFILVFVLFEQLFIYTRILIYLFDFLFIRRS